MRVPVAGAAGLIGNAVSMAPGDTLLTIDNCNDYYFFALRRARVAGGGAFAFPGAGFADPAALAEALEG